MLSEEINYGFGSHKPVTPALVLSRFKSSGFGSFLLWSGPQIQTELSLTPEQLCPNVGLSVSCARPPPHGARAAAWRGRNRTWEV